MIEKLSGHIERITFVNEENGYTVAKLKVKGQKDLVTIIGNIPNINAGEVMELTGQWMNHPKFGHQFKITSHRSIMPATLYGIEKYLGSGLIKGIGPVMGKRLVKKFGIETLKIIDQCPNRLGEVNGIGKKRIKMIQEAWDAQREIRDVMVFLQGHGISCAYATKIYKQYGKDSITKVSENPYCLAKDIFGIGFITADKIALNLGIKKDSIDRSEAGIMYALHQTTDEGHVFYPYMDLIEKCSEILQIEKDAILKGFALLSTKGDIILEDLNKNSDEFIENNKAVYLAGYYKAEVGIAKKLIRLLHSKSNISPFNIDSAIDWARKNISINLAKDQKRAIELAILKKVMVLTGGPGTGKTTIIRCILEIYKTAKARILLAAPTGRAAKKMSEATGHMAKTIHRLLEYSFQNGSGFKRDQNNPLNADVIIIDEVSMIDYLLMYHLLKAIPLDAVLILVGDADQIPSVGAGNILWDIIKSEIIPTVSLNEIFRQAMGSLIITNAHRIKMGKFPKIKSNAANKLEDFYFIERESPDEIADTIVELTTERIPKTFSFNPISDIQIITPMNRGIIGTANLNLELQKKLNLQLK